MLAPIITKDMKLFPSRPLPRNVRTRAHRLENFKNPDVKTRDRVARKPPQHCFHAMNNLSAPLSRSPPRSLGASLKKPPTALAAIVEDAEVCVDTGLLRGRGSLTTSGTASSSSSYSSPPAGDGLQAQLPSTAVASSACLLLKNSSSSLSLPSSISTSTNGKESAVKKDSVKKQMTTSTARTFSKWFNILRSKPKAEFSAQIRKMRPSNSSKS